MVVEICQIFFLWLLRWPCCCCCYCWVTSVVSDSVRPHGWQPIRLPCPWDSPGKNTGVGWDDLTILYFIWLMWCITFIDLCTSQGLIFLDHGVWSFKCATVFALLVFCWEFLSQYSSGINSIFFSYSVFIWFWYQGDGGFIKWLWECPLLFTFL